MPHVGYAHRPVALGREGIVTSSRDDNVRVSAHCYNAVEDIDAVLDGLRRNRRLLARP